jgi:gluconokinase
MATPPAVVMMGVSGSGKTTVGSALAKRLGVPFRDADGFHPKANVDKMSAGIPLTDEDRWPWLDAIAAAISATPTNEGIVVSSSALRKIYRDRIARGAGRPVTFVHLDGTKETIAPRMATRTGHFMPLSLLDSQLATLEPLGPDEPGFRVSIEQPPERIVDTIVERLRQRA